MDEKTGKSEVVVVIGVLLRRSSEFVGMCAFRFRLQSAAVANHISLRSYKTRRSCDPVLSQAPRKERPLSSTIAKIPNLPRTAPGGARRRSSSAERSGIENRSRGNDGGVLAESDDGYETHLTRF